MIRKARLRDVKEMQRLIKLYSTRGEMLPRSLSELYDNIRDFFISIQNRKVVGICALHVCWEDLARNPVPCRGGKESEKRGSGQNW